MAKQTFFVRMGKASLLGFAIWMSHGVWAQATWVKQSPIPTSNQLYDVAFPTPTRGFICGIAHTLFETTDGGNTWIPRTLTGQFSDNPYYRIYFVDQNLGFITGNSLVNFPDIWRTVNGGTSWSQVTSFPQGGSWRHVDFVSSTVGFMGANGACVKTTDGGVTWTLRSGYPNCPVMFSMDFRDQNVGLVGGVIASTGVQGIFKTTDGGATWSLKFPQSANVVAWLDTNTAIAVVGRDVYRSVNQGESWELYAPGPPTGLVSMAVVTPSLYVGVSSMGDIWRSTNGGQTWTLVMRGKGDLPDTWVVRFRDALNGWVVGKYGMIYKTTDGGLTWQQVSQGVPTTVYGIGTFTDDRPVAVALNGYTGISADGGRSWRLEKLEVTGQIFGREESLRAISVVDSQFAVTAGPGGTVFRTTDGGNTWQSIGYPVLPDLFYIYDVCFVNRSLGWLVGQDGDLGHFRCAYRTTDGGNTWTLVYSRSITPIAVDFVDTQRGWMATTGLLWRTTDGGNTWAEVTLPGGPYEDMDFCDANNGWVVGWFGSVLKSTDGGRTWVTVDIGRPDLNFSRVVCLSPQEVWITSFQGEVYHTYNGGQTWVREGVSSWPFTLSSLHATRMGNVWVGGYSGVIYRRTPPEIVPPDTFSLPRGAVVSGGIGDLLASDDQYLTLRPLLVLSAEEDPIQLVVEGVANRRNPARLYFGIEARSEVAGIRQSIDLFNFATNTWVTVDTRVASLADSLVDVILTDNPARYVNPTTGRVRARVRWKPVGPVLVYPWLIRVDFLTWSLGV